MVATESPAKLRSSRTKSRDPAERSRGPVLDCARRGVSTALDTNGIWDVLRDVPDPEIPVVSVVDLGIVRTVTADRVTITPTYTGCPATQVIERDIRAALDAAGYRGVAIETVLSPPWTTDWIGPAGRAKLHAYGIAPPSTAATATCPQCGSSDTEEVSRFGSTPCKALWRCRACAEPFDRFKCH
ncbi:MAG: phenylacetate-CoA oxygenase subunit PaaJ [Alphaproteobacteria bacterium]|nr:MAG: phenylacetate-CoA oxygenase subunit PaaJ [Alphaproteobacteria bacterium]